MIDRTSRRAASEGGRSEATRLDSRRRESGASEKEVEVIDAPLPAMSYLVITHPEDLCARRVTDALRERSHAVLSTIDPMAGDLVFAWELSTRQSSSRLASHPARIARGEE